MWVIGGMVAGENLNNHGKTCHIAAFSTTNPTWDALGPSLDLRVGRR
jgi:hypothetical protein